MFARRSFLPLLFFTLIALNGCSHVSTYNSTYLSGTPTASVDKLNGKALIYTDATDDVYIYTASPTSLTGGASKLSMELGKMTKEIARKAFGEICTDGADTENKLEPKSSYVIIVKPKVSSLSYEYNQLKNLGFAITPQVRINLDMKLLDSNGKTYFEKAYDSGVVSGDSYMIALENPGEKINRIAHEALYDLMRQAATDASIDVKRRTDIHVKTMQAKVEQTAPTPSVSSAAPTPTESIATAQEQLSPDRSKVLGNENVAPSGSSNVQLAMSYEDGVNAYGQKDYTKALSIFRSLADQGDARAQTNLGLIYELGLGVAKDDAEAVKWFRKAADQNFVTAQFNLGYMYSNGRGVTKDDAEAVKWYRKAADRGNAPAQFNLGRKYEQGEGVVKDQGEAVKWFHKAADQGYAPAQETLRKLGGQ